MTGKCFRLKARTSASSSRSVVLVPYGGSQTPYALDMDHSRLSRVKQSGDQ